MDKKLQHKLAFFLTGRRESETMRTFDDRYRPALLARYSKLSELRYDLPMILNNGAGPDRAVLSLSHLVDEAISAMGNEQGRDRVARHGYLLERELRNDLPKLGAGNFRAMWEAAAGRLATERDNNIMRSARRLWSEFDADGDLLDAGPELPSATVRHAWKAVQAVKAERFKEKAERLLLKLREILAAESITSASGRSPERLKAGMGLSFAGAFDYNAMSQILTESKPGFKLSAARKGRIRTLIGTLDQQRFYRMGKEGNETYSFAFSRCSEALAAYKQRHEEALELVKTLRIAELEVSGEYRESVHDLLFEGFGANGLNPRELAELPDYLVCTDARSLSPEELAQIVEVMSAGLPFKILVQTDDVLELSEMAEGHMAIGLRSQQLVNSAIGLTDVFVLQTSSSHLYRKLAALMRGLSFDGAALFSIFSGANSHSAGYPAYIIAAAAVESRVFPVLVYDPSAGPGWASRLTIADNPDPDLDWPVRVLEFEDDSLQALREEVPFTLADFMAMDERFFSRFSVVPEHFLDETLTAIPEAEELAGGGLPDRVPCIPVVDDKHRLLRAIIDVRTLFEARRCLAMWQSLQELGTIHSSHAERQLALQLSESLDREPEGLEVRTAETASDTQPGPAAETQPDLTEPPRVESRRNGDEPFIETPRCTSCNECIELNGQMFAYDENKQAYISDLEAGTYRQLVEAAESCQVSIIHPGKPWNPKEPGLEDLIRRAAEFN